MNKVTKKIMRGRWRASTQEPATPSGTSIHFRHRIFIVHAVSQRDVLHNCQASSPAPSLQRVHIDSLHWSSVLEKSRKLLPL